MRVHAGAGEHQRVLPDGAGRGPVGEDLVNGATLDAEIDRLTRQVAHHTRQRQADDLNAQHLVRPNAGDPTRVGEPAPSGAATVKARELASMLAGREPYRGAEPDHTDGLHR